MPHVVPKFNSVKLGKIEVLATKVRYTFMEQFHDLGNTFLS